MSEFKRPVSVVLTATINPPQNRHDIARSDPGLRLEDYKSALLFYLTLPDSLFQHILFIDNSNSDISELEKLVDKVNHNKNVEIMSFDGNNHPPSYGKGYGEFKLLDYGLTKSKYINQNSIIWKITGRLKILNLAKLIKSYSEEYDLYCDLRNVPFIGNYLGGNQWLELRIFCTSMSFYSKKFLKIYPELAYNICKQSPEQYLYNLILDDEKFTVQPRFKYQPKIEGFGGYANANYRSMRYLSKEYFRAIMRKILPSVWF